MFCQQSAIQAATFFYDSFLTDVADYRQIDALSATGYGMGYLGGVMAFLIFLTVELGHGFGWLNDYGIARFSFILAGLWWIIFGLPFLKNAHQRYSVPKEQKPIVASFARVDKNHAAHSAISSRILVFGCVFLLY